MTLSVSHRSREVHLVTVYIGSKEPVLLGLFYDSLLRVSFKASSDLTGLCKSKSELALKDLTRLYQVNGNCSIFRKRWHRGSLGDFYILIQYEVQKQKKN
jgi:hypothetical protein